MILVLFFLQAAPYPATSSSALVRDNSYFKSDWGFEIPQSESSWLRKVPSAEDPHHLATYSPYLSAPDSQARLNIRVDPISERSEGKTLSLESYVKFWSESFPKLGLEVQKIQYSTRSGKPVAVLDSMNLETKIHIRQFVFWNEKQALIFSCSDKKESFSVSVYTCEQLVDSVVWSEPLGSTVKIE